MSTATAPRMTEADWSRQLRELMAIYGWQHVHFRPALTKHGYRTPGSGDLAAGWPDFVLVRDRVIFVEIKGPTGRLSAKQTLVLAQLREAGAETYVWSPDDFDEAHSVLARRVSPSTQRPGRSANSSGPGSRR